MTLYTKCKTQRNAITEARTFAMDAAKENGSSWTGRVLLMSGDTLHITATESGKVETRITSGRERDGHLFCGPRAYAVAK